VNVLIYNTEKQSQNAPLFFSTHTYPLQLETILDRHGALSNLPTRKRKLESNTFAGNLLSPS
jgi:hypothetical protein